VQYLNAWLSAGFAVVVTDYQGLGTPGGHPYLAAKPEAYGVLDSVRAVKGRDQIGDVVLIVGQSQGAGAAFATAALAPSYAPDVKLRGTVATGLPYFSRETLAALARGRNPDAVTRTLIYTLLLLQLAEQTRPGCFLGGVAEGGVYPEQAKVRKASAPCEASSSCRGRSFLTPRFSSHSFR
jgi:pimeloyl-ACP methyl ester carboxylesterase